MKPDIPKIPRRSDRRLMMGLAQSGLELLVSELGLALFRQPALEMLFDLYNKPQEEPRYLTALCGVSSTSERNSQRIVHRMEEHGLVTTESDLEDGRRTIVSLTPLGRRAIERFLDEWAASTEFTALVDEQLIIQRVTSALRNGD
ncbi:MAG: winged helix DNA-binding protein [Novosphingobium sp.]|nr:winged helix DNA-binding protein [Novosphingobium sp.]